MRGAPCGQLNTWRGRGAWNVRRPGLTVEELVSSVFAELAMKRTRRAEEIVAEAIRMARTRPPRAEITGSRWQASTQEVRDWAISASFEVDTNGSLPEQAIS